MNTALEGFTLVSLSFQIFAFAPKLAIDKVSPVMNHVTAYHPYFKYFIVTNFFLVGVTLIMLISISSKAAITFSILLLFILVLFPLWLNWVQRYKK